MTIKPTTSRTALLTAGLAILVCSSLWAQRFPPPDGWKWVSDDPVHLVDRLSPPAGAFLFGTMAPGWHITTRPGVTLFEPTVTVRGRFVIESESFLFPGTSSAGFGVFAGGTDLESQKPSYTAFLIRRDGSAAVERREAGKSTLVQAWTRHEAIVPHPGGNADVRNVIRVEAEAATVAVVINGTKVFDVARSSAPVDGIVGLRIGPDTDLHVTNLDVTRRLALPRPNREP
jgi:hypothetical protein